ncbi:hypothetical protein BP6252_10898 [Coleophoma cylindrospora]|uniref:HNH nuclease domain-containing protein n=1 Tax=Coleophoma cylindrospora TaxID=1849047 RepID=A0A3D8QNF1_9HELO|nr:hypothetical protein BP6252_10898 [Coleophoma cylindrospora]
MNLRAATAPPPKPPTCTDRSRYISFAHPAYEEPTNTLLRLYAPDLPGRRGLDYQYALVACGIVAGNRWDGWLTLDKDSEERVEPDSILQAANYYFHLPCPPEHDFEVSSIYQYPVVPNFEEWPFPAQLPESWNHLLPTPAPTQHYSASTLSVAVKHRDTFCRVSGCRDAVQAAHLCPVSEEQWFRKNNMGRYSSESSARNSINSPANACLLRADLHYLHDYSYFVFVPKKDSNGGRNVVLHLTEPLDEIESLYQNRKLHPLQVSPEYLFARFARTIFPSLQDFLLAQVPRRIKIGRDIASMMTPAELEDFSGKSARSRSHSPKKRKGSTDPNPTMGDGGHQRKRLRTSPSHDHQISISDVHESTPPTQQKIQTPKNDSYQFSHGSSSEVDNAISPDLPVTALDMKLATSSEMPEPVTPASITLLKDQWLSKERTRSRVEGATKEEEAWLDNVYAGKPMVGDEAIRWFEAQGFEFQSLDDSGDNNQG